MRCAFETLRAFAKSPDDQEPDEMRKNLGFALATVALAASVACAAGRFNKVVSIGDAAPDWANIEGTDGKQHSLSDYKDAKMIVEIFTCNHCPVAQLYEDRLIQLQSDYAAKGVKLVAISVSNVQGDGLAEMKAKAQEKGFNFPYLHDPTQAAGRAIGAQHTPQAFVLDANRKIVYMGGIDNKWDNPEAVTKTYLRDAIDAALAGRAPEVQETRATGCGIEYQPLSTGDAK
jgi:peroxiredoxin